MDGKGNDPCIWIEHSIFNVNKIGVILTLVCVDQRYPAALKRSELNYLGVGCFPRPLVKGSEDTGYEVVFHHGKFKLLNHCIFFLDKWASWLVASWLVRSTPEQALRVRALAGDIVLCS